MDARAAGRSPKSAQRLQCATPGEIALREDMLFMIQLVHHLAYANPELPAAPLAEAEAPAAAEAPCLWSPRSTTAPEAAFFSYHLGCELAPAGPDAWRTVTEVNEASLELFPDKTIVRAVFVDAQQRRVAPIGRTITWEMKFKHHKTGTMTLSADQLRGGVFTLELPANERGAPCETHLSIGFDNGTKKVQMWIDDWQFSC
jgi:hypothetical protein